MQWISYSVPMSPQKGRMRQCPYLKGVGGWSRGCEYHSTFFHQLSGDDSDWPDDASEEGDLLEARAEACAR